MADQADNTVFVGKKEVVKYILAVATQATKNDIIIIKARGRDISKAVDISQMAINRQLQGWEVSDVKVGTDERPYTPREGDDPKHRRDTVRVSFIEITIVKKPISKK